MTLQDRVEVALVPKVESALAYVQEELEDRGFINLDLSSLSDQFVSEMRQHFAENDESEETQTFKFGVKGESQPNSLARSVVCVYLKRWLKQVFEIVEAVEKNEDSKLENWVEKATGKSCRIDFGSLIAVETDPSDQIVNVLNTAYQVLHYESDRLQNLVGQVADSTDGVAAFVKDLASARFSDERIESVLLDLLDAEEPGVIDEVLEHDEIKGHEQFKAIQFFGGLLKKAIEADVKAEDWKTMHDDEDDSEKAA